MIGRKEDGLEDDPDRLGRLAIQALALLGGLAGLLIAAFHLLGSVIFSTSSHGLGGWGLLYQIGGAVFLLLALAGIAGAALYRQEPEKGRTASSFLRAPGFSRGLYRLDQLGRLPGLGGLDSCRGAAHRRRHSGARHPPGFEDQAAGPAGRGHREGAYRAGPVYRHHPGRSRGDDCHLPFFRRPDQCRTRLPQG